MRFCEYFKTKSHTTHGKTELIPVCSLTGRPCFVDQPESASGQELQNACTRRAYALSMESPSRAQATDPPAGIP